MSTRSRPSSSPAMPRTTTTWASRCRCQPMASRALVASPDVNVSTVLNAGAGCSLRSTLRPTARPVRSRASARRASAPTACAAVPTAAAMIATVRSAPPPWAPAPTAPASPLPSTTVSSHSRSESATPPSSAPAACHLSRRWPHRATPPSVGRRPAPQMLPELCDGSSVDCPANLLRPAGYAVQGSTGPARDLRPRRHLRRQPQ